jgi:hypothetical protein
MIQFVRIMFPDKDRCFVLYFTNRFMIFIIKTPYECGRISVANRIAACVISLRCQLLAYSSADLSRRPMASNEQENWLGTVTYRALCVYMYIYICISIHLASNPARTKLCVWVERRILACIINCSYTHKLVRSYSHYIV